MTFWGVIKASYAGSLAFILACPTLIAVPVVLEVVQHAVEVRAGMYASPAAAKLADADPLRLAFGLMKVAALTLTGYWVVRFLAWRDAARAVRLDCPAARLFARFLAFQVGLTAIELFVLPRSGALLLVESVVGILLLVLLAGWSAAAPLGNARIGPLASVSLMSPQLPWGVAVTLATTVPLLAPHNALAVLALIGPKWLLWPVLIVDSLLVGLLAAVIASSGYFIAQRAAGRRAVSLIADLAGC